VKGIGEDEIGRRTSALRERLKGNLSALGGIRVYGGDTPPCGSLLFDASSDPEQTAAALDHEGFALRSGFHCAPSVLERLGCGEFGALRASFSYFNTAREIDLLTEAIETIIKKGTV